MSPRIHSETVSFRADEDLLRLMDQVRARFGVSRGEWVRGVVHGELYQTEQASLELRLFEIEQGIERLKAAQDAAATKQARALFAVLTLVGNVPAEDARQLIRANFAN